MTENPERKPSSGRLFLGALLWMQLVSMAICFFPLVGGLFAGFMGGRHARKPGIALAAAVVPTLFWLLLMRWAGTHEFIIGKNSITPAPLTYLAPLWAGSVLGGALLGAAGKHSKVSGIAVVILSALVSVPKAYTEFKTVADQFKQIQAEKYEPERNKTCPENLKQLYNAMLLYADSWDGTLPPADRWMTAIKENVPKDDWLHCPEVSKTQRDGKFGYGFNAALGGKKLADVMDKDKTILLFESSDLGENVHDEIKSLPNPGRHTGRNNVVFTDGKTDSQAPK